MAAVKMAMGNFAYSVAWSPDGSLLAYASEDNRDIVLLDPTAAVIVARLPSDRDGANAVAWSPNGTWLIAVSKNGSVRVWDVAERRCFAMLRVNNVLTSCAWQPTTNAIVVGGTRGIHLLALEAPNG